MNEHRDRFAAGGHRGDGAVAALGKLDPPSRTHRHSGRLDPIRHLERRISESPGESLAHRRRRLRSQLDDELGRLRAAQTRPEDHRYRPPRGSDSTRRPRDRLERRRAAVGCDHPAQPREAHEHGDGGRHEDRPLRPASHTVHDSQSLRTRTSTTIANGQRRRIPAPGRSRVRRSRAARPTADRARPSRTTRRRVARRASRRTRRRRRREPQRDHGRPSGKASTNRARNATHRPSRTKPSVQRPREPDHSRSAARIAKAAAANGQPSRRQRGRSTTRTNAAASAHASARSVAIRAPATFARTPSHPATRPPATTTGNTSTGSRISASVRNASRRLSPSVDQRGKGRRGELRLRDEPARPHASIRRP